MSHYYRNKVGGYVEESRKQSHGSGGTQQQNEGGVSGPGKVYDNKMRVMEKPLYLLEHLATFTVNKDSGITHPLDGMRRLLQMEKNTGIWSQKMQLCLDQGWVLIIDYETGDVIERFPVSLIKSPTAFTSADVLDLYNNILIFIVSGDNGARSEMHIFQSQSASAVNLVEDLKAMQEEHLFMKAQKPPALNPYDQLGGRGGNSHMDNESHGISNLHGQQHGGHYSKEQKYQRSSAKGNITVDYHHKDHLANDLDEIGSDVASGFPENSSDVAAVAMFDDASSVSSDKYERDVNILNHCFDDIEKFIARLQHAAAASREIERRRRETDMRKKENVDGLMTLHTRPPVEKDFLDILAKFKLSFNLLSKLKTHIHDPNAPELVHFLFTPLALIVEAARDTYCESQLASKVIDPLLTSDTINFLKNCVSSKETELWRSLGDAWTIPKDQWREDVCYYHPEFSDNCSPDGAVGIPSHNVSDFGRSSRRRGADMMMEANKGSPSRDNAMFGGKNSDSNYKYRPTKAELAAATTAVADQQYDMLNSQEAYGIESEETSGIHDITTGLHNMHTHESAAPFNYMAADHVNTSSTMSFSPTIEKGRATTEVSGGGGGGGDKFVEKWLNKLRSKGANIAVVCYPRIANNDKELSVVKGEYLEILDDTRKWWKARNVYGQVAHVPNTIVAALENAGGDNFRNQNTYGRFQSQNKIG